MKGLAILVILAMMAIVAGCRASGAVDVQDTMSSPAAQSVHQG